MRQSKSTVSLQIRGLVDWNLVHRLRLPGSRKDHYEAATDFWRVMQEIMERRFRWNLRQMLAAADETERAARESDLDPDFLTDKLERIRAFFGTADTGVASLSRGRPFEPPMLLLSALTNGRPP